MPPLNAQPAPASCSTLGREPGIRPLSFAYKLTLDDYLEAQLSALRSAPPGSKRGGKRRPPAIVTAFRLLVATSSVLLLAAGILLVRGSHPAFGSLAAVTGLATFICFSPPLQRCIVLRNKLASQWHASPEWAQEATVFVAEDGLAITRGALAATADRRGVRGGRETARTFSFDAAGLPLVIPKAALSPEETAALRDRLADWRAMRQA
jgi:hypothetical protein